MAQTNNTVQKYVSVGGPLTDARIVDDGTNIELVPTFTPFESVTWANSSVRSGRALSGASTSGAGSQECVANLQATVPITSSDHSYEKMALFVAIRTADESDAGASPPVNLDAVGAHLTAGIAADNPQGRIWAANCVVTCDTDELNPDTDGLMTGIEIDVRNNANVDESELSTPYNKTGLSIVAQGAQNSTNAVVITATNDDGANTGRWHRGVVAFDTSFSASAAASFLELVKVSNGDRVFRVTPTGAVTAASVRPGTFLPRYEIAAGSPPSMAAGEVMIWGNSSDGFTYIVFYDGANYLKMKLT